ncbi:MAG: NAD-dependent epimerase/dehydratase family protein [Anaerolineaceae bacterium]
MAVLKALVTGSSGFIGSRLCRRLLTEGWEVRAFHRPSSSLKMLEDLPVEHALGDLNQPASVQEAVKDIDVVFHAAAMLGGRDKSGGGMYTVTVEGTRTVMQASLGAGVKRLVHISSVAALGVPDEGPGIVSLMNENHAWNYRPDFWPYGYTKYLAEVELQKAVALGLDAVMVNPSVVLGAGDIYRSTSSIVFQVAHRKIPCLVEGGANFVHIQDVLDGILAAYALGKRGCRYLLTAENLTHVELVETISGITGVNRPGLMVPAGLLRSMTGVLNAVQPFFQFPIEAVNLRQAGYYFFYDARRTQIELRLTPPRPVVEAIRETWDWLNGSLAAIPQFHS